MSAKKKEAVTWEAYGGVEIIKCGKRRNGKPLNAIVATMIVAFSASDVKALEKAYPRLKFKPRGDVPTRAST